MEDGSKINMSDNFDNYPNLNNQDLGVTRDSTSTYAGVLLLNGSVKGTGYHPNLNSSRIMSVCLCMYPQRTSIFPLALSLWDPSMAIGVQARLWVW